MPGSKVAERLVAHGLLSPLLNLEVHHIEGILIFVSFSSGSARDGLVEFVAYEDKGQHGLQIWVFDLSLTQDC